MTILLAILGCIILGEDGVGETGTYALDLPYCRFIEKPSFDLLHPPYDVPRFIWSLDRSGPKYVWYKDPYWTKTGVIVHPVEMYGDFDGDGDVDLRDIAKLQVKASEGLENVWADDP